MLSSSRVIEKNRLDGIRYLLMGLMCLGAAGIHRAAAADLQFKAQLIWATDEEKPKDNPKVTDLDEKVRGKIKTYFRWKNYYQIDQETFKVPEKGSKITCISQKCVIEVAHLGASVFSSEDIKSPHGFYTKLKQPSDAVSVYLNEQLSEVSRKELASYKGQSSDPQALNNALVEDFNKIMMGRAIYDAKRFADVKLQPATQQLLQSKPQGQDLVRLNRLLLEDAYPLEIEKNLHLDGCMIQVKLYGEGKFVVSTKQNLPLNEILVLAGKDMDKKSDAWCVVLTRKESK